MWRTAGHVTACCRGTALFTAVACCVFKSQVDAYLQRLWATLRTSSIVKHDSFEPAVVVIAFAAWHLLYFCLDSCFFDQLKPWRIQFSDDRKHWAIQGKGR